MRELGYKKRMKSRVTPRFGSQNKKKDGGNIYLMDVYGKHV